ncbi:hypothetical protein GUJ93_ZPchr0001g31058 [Zizania palustris]|uniref:Uncharacterized protein n=1 Tax=Zizania palustris TaxID=103762 RepID=A0A8J5VP91_ZIZPA|nr:hypothetical protein GUJ93_ZPchr0001g31058 [Zizania palustris]
MSSISRFLRRASLTAAVVGTAAVALSDLKMWRISMCFNPPSPQADAGAATRGHQGLIRAHPRLRELNEALSSRDAFFLDATHALAASALRVPTMTGLFLHLFLQSGGGSPRSQATAESRGASYDAVHYRIQQSLLRAREGRFDEALADVARLAGDSPGDPRPRFTASALCCLHGRYGTAVEWMKSIPRDTRIGGIGQFENAIVIAMPGSSPRSFEQGTEGNVMCAASRFAEDMLLLHFMQGQWSIREKLEVFALVSLLHHFVSKHGRCRGGGLRRFVSKHRRAAPASDDLTKSIPKREFFNGNLFYLVECFQAILATVLRARPLCGDRLREVRALSERALLLAAAEGDDLAVVDVNLLLALLATRDGHFHEAMRRYAAAVRKDPSDPRPYELAAMLCSLFGQTEWRDLWRAAKEQRGHGTKGLAELPALLDELVVAAALGGAVLTAIDEHSDPRGGLVLLAAWREVDAALAAAVRDKNLTFLESCQIRALHSVLHAKLKPLLHSANHGLQKNSRENE